MPGPYPSGHRDDLPRSRRVNNNSKSDKRASDTSEYSTTPGADQVDVQFQSVLRLRPLSRKERDDHVVLEGIIPASQKESAATAVLHPFAAEDAVVVGTSMTNRTTTIQRGLETEYHFNHLLPLSADQDKVYYMIGLPMALSAMEPLKGKNTTNDHSTTTNNSLPIKTHLVLCMGTSNAGKTYTAFGKSLSKRRNADDGLVPRILDSLFSQSKHHMSSSSSSNKHISNHNNGNQYDFAVLISLLQVDASSSSPSTSPDDATIRDLLQSETAQSSGGGTRARSISPMSRQRSVQSVKAMIANFEHHDSHDAGSVRIVQDETTKDFRVQNATIQTCRDVAEAREALQQGLARKKRGPFGKAIKGHTIVTLQPVLLEPKTDHVRHHGGMLAILDMASSKRKGSLNGRSAVTMKDNMADSSTLSAVMHCLRTLQHNSNVQAGRAPTLDIVNDDELSVDASEISCVSDLNKDSYHHPKQQRQLRFKTVPYRQSKLTMLLQPFFSPRSCWNNGAKTSFFQTMVTILLTAYPGHRDYMEKKSFLNDLELLHGFSLTSSGPQQHNGPPPVATTGLDENNKKEKSSHQPVLRASYETDPIDEYDNLLGKRSFSGEDQDSVDYDPLPNDHVGGGRDVEIQNSRYSDEHPGWVHHTSAPYHNNSKGPLLANAPPSNLMETDSLALSESMDEDDVILPPPFVPVLATAPEHPNITLLQSSTTQAAHSPATLQSTTHSTVERQFSSPPILQSTPMDFPGVEILSKSKPLPAAAKTTTTTTVASIAPSRSRSPNRQVHFPALYSSPIPTATVVHQAAPSPHRPAPTTHNIQSISSTAARNIANPQVITTTSATPRIKRTEQRKDEKSKSPAIPWLSHSSPMKSINKVVNASRMTGMKVLEKMTRDASPVDMHTHHQTISSTTSSRSQAVSSPIVVPSHRTNEFDVHDSATKEALMRKIQYLEDHNKDLMKELGEIATRCATLEEEKNALSRQLREAHRRRLDSDWTALDEQEWQKSRKNRIDQQQLIRSPLQHHLTNVQSTFQMKNQWMEGGKPHFELSFPGNFRRAAALDRRDREAAANAAAAATTASGTEVDDVCRGPMRTPLSSSRTKERLNHDGQRGSNHKRLQLFKQLIERDHKKKSAPAGGVVVGINS